MESHEWKQSVVDLGDVVMQLVSDIQGCGVTSVLKILESAAKQLGDNALASDVGKVVQFLASGVDIATDIQQIVTDSARKDWAALGHDLGGLSTWLNSTDCRTLSCRILEGVLIEADMALTDLKPCEKELQTAEQDFFTGAQLWGQKQHTNAVNYWSAGLSTLGKSVDACGLTKQLKYLQQEANVFGLGNVTIFGTAVSVLVHGQDIAEEVSAAWNAFADRDYRSVGKNLHMVASQLFNWTTSNLCDSDACYVLNGVLQYSTSFSLDFKKCDKDMTGMMSKFVAGFEDISGHFQASNATNTIGYTKNVSAIRKGIGEIGQGFSALADSIGDCHMQVLFETLTKLAAKLGLSPHIAIAEEVIEIVIDGVPIERAIAGCLQDYGQQNWPGLGYHLIQLVEDLFAVPLLTSAMANEMIVI